VKGKKNITNHQLRIMQNKREVRIKVSKQRVEALFSLYGWLIGIWENESEHEFLLFSHVTVMYDKLQRILLLNDHQRKSFTLVMNEAEAMAFCLIWKDRSLSHDVFGKVIILDMMGKIDKTRHQIN